MITRSCAVVETGGVLRAVSGGPPLTIRQVRHEDRGICCLCLVGSAAGPLAGDQVELSLDVRPGARAVVTAAGASVAQGRPAGDAATSAAMPGVLSTEVRVGDTAQLHAEPAPLIVSAGSSVLASVSITLAAGASLHWRELLVLGRTGEAPGSAVLHWTVHRGGLPLLVQSTDLAAGPGRREWAGMMDGNRVWASALVSGPHLSARTLVDSPTAVCQKLDEHSVLITVLDTDAVAAETRLDELVASADGGC